MACARPGGHGPISVACWVSLERTAARGGACTNGIAQGPGARLSSWHHHCTRHALAPIEAATSTRGRQRGAILPGSVLRPQLAASTTPQDAQAAVWSRLWDIHWWGMRLLWIWVGVLAMLNGHFRRRWEGYKFWGCYDCCCQLVVAQAAAGRQG
ncbi:MAG: hypothetical protein J3K34DRAFT_428982 [Monoraphidium minutum]|nr:MAG: hypothetical protein J3K34DRAFT_428982 [Monoraphidium minutum]